MMTHDNINVNTKINIMKPIFLNLYAVSVAPKPPMMAAISSSFSLSVPTSALVGFDSCGGCAWCWESLGFTGGELFTV